MYWKKLRLLTVLCLFMALLSSCEPEPKLSEHGSIRMPIDEGCIIKEGSANLLTLTADYPMLKVSSTFSTVSGAPEIAYLGQFHDLVEIPTETTDTFSSQAVIHNTGGYLVKMRVIKSGTNTTQTCIVKLLIQEGPFYTDEAPAYLDIRYEIYRQ